MKPLLEITSTQRFCPAAASPGRGGKLRSRASLGLGAQRPQPPRATAECPEREYGVKKPNILLANPLCSPPSSGQFWKGIFQDLHKVSKKHRFPFLCSSSNEPADKRGVSSCASALETSALSSGMEESHRRGPGASVGAQSGRSSPGQELKNSGTPRRIEPSS